MNLSTVATLAGYKSHYTADGKRTLCGREVSNSTSGIDMCKACDKAAAKLREAEAAETPAPAPSADAPSRELVIHFGYSSEGVQCGATQDTPYGSACTLDLSAVTCDACRTAHAESNPFARAARDAETEREETETADAFDMANLTPAQITVLETNIGRVPETVRAAQEITRSGDLASREHTARYFDGGWGSTVLRADVDPAAYSSAVCNANDTAREEGYARLTVAWFSCFDSTYAMAKEQNDTDRESAEWHAQQDAENAAEYAAMLAATHVIEFTGNDVAMCGEPVRQADGILRVTTDATDATCSDCIAQEAALAAEDAQDGPTDDEIHAAALEAALSRAKSHVDLSSLSTARPPRRAHARTTPASAARTYPRTENGRTVWACCESSIGEPCQHRTGARTEGAPMVVVEPSRTDRHKVVAWLIGLNTTLRREFRSDRATRLHVAYWAQTHGVRPAAGKRFAWQQHETLSLAPARI